MLQSTEMARVGCEVGFFLAVTKVWNAPGRAPGVTVWYAEVDPKGDPAKAKQMVYVPNQFGSPLPPDVRRQTPGVCQETLVPTGSFERSFCGRLCPPNCQTLDHPSPYVSLVTNSDSSDSSLFPSGLLCRQPAGVRPCLKPILPDF